MDEKEWNKNDGVSDIGDNAGDTGDGVGGSKDRVKVEDDDEAMGVETVDKNKTNTDDEAMGVESAQKKNMKTDAMALDADGEAEHGESQEEVVVPKESDVSSRADGENNTMAVPPLALPSASAQAPTLPPGNNCPTPECMKLLGPLVYEASVSAFQHVVLPMIEQSVQSGIKRHLDEMNWYNGGSGQGGGVGAWPNEYKKKNMGRNSPASSSQSSSWRGPDCQDGRCKRCYDKLTEYESKDWKESWDLSLKTPAELRDGPVSWSQSMNTYLYNATAKAIAEGKPKREWPNYDAATISLVTNKMEKVLYDLERWQNQYRFLLLWKSPKHITLACQFCRNMSTLEYATLEPRDGRRLHWFFHHHLGGGVADQGQRRHN